MAGREREDGADGAANGRVDGLPVFRGVTLLALDAKGRLAIPARHRDALMSVSGDTVWVAVSWYRPGGRLSLEKVSEAAARLFLQSAR